jgi:hypothetical protein
MKTMRLPLLVKSLACLALLLASGTSRAVGTQRLELNQGDDLKGGDLQGVAIDTSGKVRAGFNLGNVPVSGADSIWSALLQRDGSLLVGTGSEGKLFKYAGGSLTLLAEAKGLAITSLVEAWNGTVAVATIPDGVLFKWQGGKLSELAKLPGAAHVWSLAYDRNAKVVYAGTGPEGKLFRITAAGDAQVYFDADEEHIMSVALAADGRVFAGASDKAKLYEISGAGRANVLYDFGTTEVRALAVSANNDVYAIANDIKTSGTPGRKQNQFDAAAPVNLPAVSRGKGTLFRFNSKGEPERLYESKDEQLVSLALGQDGRPYVGTGVEGRVYTVDGAHNVSLVADVAERRIGALVLSDKAQFVLAGDPAVVHPVRGVGGADAVWTSKALDLGIRAKFGQLGWTAAGDLELSTRTGNTAEPDKTWSPWSAPIAAPTVIQSPAARYIQVRARFNRDPKAVLSDIVIPFVTDNLRHVVTSLQTDDTNATAPTGNGEIKSSGGPINKKAEQRITLKWKVDNPDSDELRYRLQYRLVGSSNWYDVLEPDEKLSKDSYTWDTSNLPEGRYKVRVIATDELANPPELVQRDELESSIVLVDNTPPIIAGLAANGRRIRGVAIDGVGPIARIEVAVAGRDNWVPYFPRDGVFDQAREEFEADVSGSVPAGPAIVSVRVYDQANNFVVSSIQLK